MLSSREITLDGKANWDKLTDESTTATFFQTYNWLTFWTKHFPQHVKIIGIYENEALIGIAPFSIKDGKAEILGTTAVFGKELVTDFGDIIVKKEREKEVWEAVRSKVGGNTMQLDFIRENSPSFRTLKDLGGGEEEDTAPYIDLPDTWDVYLSSLDRHSRHELRRKIRKLEREGAFKTCEEENEGDSEFLRLMSLSSDQKRNFLSEGMKNFFTDLIKNFSMYHTLQLCFLKLGSVNIAAALIFKFKDEILLYNSGFDPKFSYLSPGLLLKAYLIKDAIEKGFKKFDFLRGGERYKYDLGGKERKLYKFMFQVI